MIPREEIVAAIDAITVEEVSRVALAMLETPPTISAVGPIRKLDAAGPSTSARTARRAGIMSRRRCERPADGVFPLSHSRSEETPLVRGEGLTLRPPRQEDFEEWAELRERSRDFLRPWEPIWPVDDLTRGAFRRRIRRYQREIQEDHGLSVLRVPGRRLGPASAA